MSATPNKRKKSSSTQPNLSTILEGDSVDSHQYPDLPLPLLNEIDELIQKERTLLQLQLMDQELEKEIWKSKYDQLKEKVIEDVFQEEEDIQLFQTIAATTTTAAADDEEDQEIHNYYIPTDPNYLLISRIEDTIGKFSYVNFTHDVFFRVMKELFRPKGRAASSASLAFDGPEVNILWLDHCQLGHGNSEILNNVIKNPRLDAIDLSYNHIDGEMMINFINTLSNRRKTPQYLLLQGNMLYAAQAKTFTDFFKVLSEDTWGFTISLQDYSNHSKEMREKEVHVAKRRGVKDEALAYRDLAKHPLKAHSFLKGLHDYLRKLRTTERSGLADKKKPRAAGKTGPVQQRTLFPFRYLMVLGLTDCHLSRQSIDLLQETYESLSETLTELDLSFCYMGLYGLETIKYILTDKECQLISLNLKGNVLYDPGAMAISENIKKNKSITFLDLSSNGISMTAIRTMLNQIAKSTILNRVDLRTNDFSAEEVIEISYKLQEHGSLIDFIFDEFPHQDPLLRQMMKIHPKFYCQPQLRKQLCSIGKARTIMEVDFNRLSSQYPKEYLQQPIMIQWFFRPMPMISFDQVQQTLIKNIHQRTNYTVKTVNVPMHPPLSLNSSTFIGTATAAAVGTSNGLTPLPTNANTTNAIDTTLHDPNSSFDATVTTKTKKIQKKILFEDPFLHINELFTISFEIRFLQKNTIVWQYDKPFTISDLRNREYFTTSMEWFHCYEIIPQLPLLSSSSSSSSSNKYKLQIRLKCIPTPFYLQQHYEFDSTVRALHFQLKSCFITHFTISSTNYYYLGGDPKDDRGNTLRHQYSHHRPGKVDDENQQRKENEERNLAIQEAFERETVPILFDSVNYWFQDHILMRFFEFHYAHITKRCKIRWNSKLYVKQYTDPHRFDLDSDLEEEDGEEEEEDLSDNEEDGTGKKHNNKSKRAKGSAISEQNDKPERYPFRLDYYQLLENANNLLSSDLERSAMGGGITEADRFSLVDREEVDEINEDEEEMMYEELLEIDAMKKRPKFYDYITYEWTVSVLEAVTSKRRIIETICCDYQSEDIMEDQRRKQDDLQAMFEDDEAEEVEDGEGDGGNVKISSGVPEQLLLPWMWESFELEVDGLRPGDLVILSGRVLQKELTDPNDFPPTQHHHPHHHKLPRKKDLSRLIKYLSIQVKDFESYLYIDENIYELSPQKATAKIPFIYPSTAIYGLPSYELPYEQFVRYNSIIHEAEHDLHHPNYQDYFITTNTDLSDSSRLNGTNANSTRARTLRSSLRKSQEPTINITSPTSPIRTATITAKKNN